jgi:predicted transcriptional regulator
LTKNESTKESIINTIKENPGLHFRELQRRSGFAVGQLEYHLYQLLKENRITTRQDGKLIRYFSNETGNARLRNISYHLRGRISRDIIIELLRKNEKTLRKSSQNDEKYMFVIDAMSKDGIIDKHVDQGVITIRLKNRQEIMDFLSQYRNSFLDSLAYTMLDLFEERE